MWEAMIAVPIVLGIGALVWGSGANARGWLTSGARVR
jgi:hypothetical protein